MSVTQREPMSEDPFARRLAVFAAFIALFSLVFTGAQTWVMIQQNDAQKQANEDQQRANDEQRRANTDTQAHNVQASIVEALAALEPYAQGDPRWQQALDALQTGNDLIDRDPAEAISEYEQARPLLRSLCTLALRKLGSGPAGQALLLRCGYFQPTID